MKTLRPRTIIPSPKALKVRFQSGKTTEQLLTSRYLILALDFRLLSLESVVSRIPELFC